MTAARTSAGGAAGAAWKLFASVRLTIVLLTALAATSIVGTLIPQNLDAHVYADRFGETLYRFFAVLGVFDMYHAWWFELLLLALAANVVVCSIDRMSAARGILFVRRPRYAAARFRSVPDAVEFTDPRPPEALREVYPAVFRRRARRVAVAPEGDGFMLFGETGRWSRFGVYAVHLSVVVLLIGGLIGSIFGFDGYVNIPEGETVQQILLRNGGERLRLEFAIRCDDFDVSFYETGAPKEFRSRLTLLENGREVLQKDIIVNDPLRYRGISIFQSSYGRLPTDEAVLSFTSRRSGMIYTREAAIGREIELPEGLGRLVLTELRRQAMFRGNPIGDAFVGRLTAPDGRSEEILLPLRFPTFDRMRRGEVTIAIDQFKEKYYTGLQVNRDPGVGVVYAGFILMILGCYVTFFRSHQQLCVEVRRDGGSARVRLAGTANKNQAALARSLERLAGALRRAGGKAAAAESAAASE
jgi:cytochrome c biogenesis protein